MVAIFINIVAALSALADTIAVFSASLVEAKATLAEAEKNLATLIADHAVLARNGGDEGGTNALVKKTSELVSKISSAQSVVEGAVQSVERIKAGGDLEVTKARQRVLALLEANKGSIQVRLDKSSKGSVVVSASCEALNVTDASAMRKRGISVFPSRDAIASLADEFGLELDRPEERNGSNVSLTFNLATGEVKKWTPKKPKG